MAESGENLPNNSENVTSSFASNCKDTAKYIGVGVPVQVGVILATKGVLNALGMDLDIPVLTAVSTPSSMMITKALLGRSKPQ